jgi:hypothetical protein
MKVVGVAGVVPLHSSSLAQQTFLGAITALRTQVGEHLTRNRHMCFSSLANTKTRNESKKQQSKTKCK